MMRRILNTVVIFIFLWSAILFPVMTAMAQDTCAEILKQAEQDYFEGKFDQSITLVRSCLKTGNLPSAELVQAYKILAQAYLAKNNPDVAGQLIKKIIEIKPDYAPTIADDPPPYVQLVDSIKTEISVQTEAVRSGDTNWLWLGAGGVAVIGVITIIALSGNEEDAVKPKPLPTPPSFPPVNE